MPSTSIPSVLRAFFDNLSGDSSDCSLNRCIRRALVVENHHVNVNQFNHENADFDTATGLFGGPNNLNSGMLSWARSDSGKADMSLDSAWRHVISEAQSA